MTIYIGNVALLKLFVVISQMSSSDRTLINAFKEIGSMADRINLPKSIVDRANFLFKQVHDGRNLKGRSNDAIASACLYIACRQEGVPRTFKVCSFSTSNARTVHLESYNHLLIFFKGNLRSQQD